LQEQLQAERDLRAALEVGLSMSSGQFSNSRGMDSKVCVDPEELCIFPLFCFSFFPLFFLSNME
jgi:hypothetical protein